jgi:hypothetical protein
MRRLDLALLLGVLSSLAWALGCSGGTKPSAGAGGAMGGGGAAGGGGGGRGTGGGGGPDGSADLAAGASDAPGGGGGATAGTGGGGAGGGGGARLDAGPDLAAADANGGADLSGGAGGREECRTDVDCPLPPSCPRPPCSDSVCKLGNDGFHHCETRLHPALLSCPSPANPSIPCCLADAECTKMPRGHCIPYVKAFCGSPGMTPGNVCRYDQCAADTDCTARPNGFCSGGYPRECLYGPCRTNADCIRSAGGRCVMASYKGNAGTDACTNTQVFCRYSTDPCETDADCKGDAGPYGKVCMPNADLQGASCWDRAGQPP